MLDLVCIIYMGRVLDLVCVIYKGESVRPGVYYI